VLPEEFDAFVEFLIAFIEGRWSGDTESLDDRMDGTKIMLRRRYIIPPAYRHDWSRVIYSLEDVTDRTKAERRAEHLSQHDILTDLPNRVLLQDRLENALGQAKRHDRLVALHVIGLDRFKDVNWSSPHELVHPYS
jgi:predicted signal transduction protein with EAL and GGDEF domain